MLNAKLEFKRCRILIIDKLKLSRRPGRVFRVLLPRGRFIWVSTECREVLFLKASGFYNVVKIKMDKKQKLVGVEIER